MAASKAGDKPDSLLSPLPAVVRRLLVWHQGALGDLLLALPTLKALAGHYPGAVFTGVGQPVRWRLLQESLPLAAVWDSSDQLWLELYAEGEIAPALRRRLSVFDLAVVFGVRPDSPLRRRLEEVGLPCLWLPSFPSGGRVSVTDYQLRFLCRMGLTTPERDRCLELPPATLALGRRWRQEQNSELVLALAPGSGHPKKNWPLPSFLDLAAALRARYRAKVWWVLGPAETGVTAALLELLPPKDRLFLADLPLDTLAAHLYWCDYYIGNDSGVTHLAAACGRPWVLALFGPSDPCLWAPRGPRVRVIASRRPCAPCTAGREIPCPRPQCLEELPAPQVLATLAALTTASPQPDAVQHKPQETTQKDP